MKNKDHIRQFCALLLAFSMVLGAFVLPGVGGVFALETNQTEQITETAAQPVTEAATQSVAEPTTEPVAETATQSVAEPTTEPVAEPTAEPGSETGTNEELPMLSFYEQLMACGSLTDFETLLCAEKNTASLNALNQEEWKHLLVRAEEIYAGIDQPTEADTLLKEELLKKLKEHMIVICPECGETDSHAETCSQYVAEPADYPWAELTDPELAAWLMDEANVDTVKAILGSDSEEYAALNSRIEGILGGEDTELARQLQEYLSTLMGMDESEVMEGDPAYIYFDLAAGNVTIGKATYEGWVFVNGAATEVRGTHAADNKYYVYQSTEANRSSTGYATQETDAKTGCRLPVYDRVQKGGTPWSTYVTNNTDVKAVSNAWEEAAQASDRTSTGYHITFESESNYSADVTIDNI